MALVVAAALLGPIYANAAIVTYDFTVTGTSGPDTGDVASGTLSFDNSILSGPSGFIDGPQLSQFNFSWDGVNYNQSTANTGELSTYPAGYLSSLLICGSFSSPTCPMTAGTHNFSLSLGIDYTASGTVYSGTFEYASPSSTQNFFDGTVVWGPAPVPLPATIWLMLGGLGAFGALAQKKRAA